MVSTYRYGFNGKENDNEVKGEGAQQDYGARIYDSRLGRFLSVDPLTIEYPYFTPFQSSDNNPIVFIDAEGGFAAFGDDTKVLTRTYKRVKITIQRPEIQRMQKPSKPSGWGTTWSIAKFFGKVTSVFALVAMDQNSGYAGPGAGGTDELAPREMEILTDDPSRLTDYYLHQVKEKMAKGTATDNERGYASEMKKRGIIGAASHEAHNLASYQKLKSVLSRLELTSNFHEDGTLKDEAIKAAKPIINGLQLGESTRGILTSDGSRAEDWNKMSLVIKQFSMGGERSIDIHFYYNESTGKVYYDLDYKTKFSPNYYKQTETQKEIKFYEGKLYKKD